MSSSLKKYMSMLYLYCLHMLTRTRIIFKLHMSVVFSSVLIDLKNVKRMLTIWVVSQKHITHFVHGHYNVNVMRHSLTDAYHTCKKKMM